MIVYTIDVINMATYDGNSDGSYGTGTNGLNYNNITYIRISRGRFDPPLPSSGFNYIHNTG